MADDGTRQEGMCHHSTEKYLKMSYLKLVIKLKFAGIYVLNISLILVLESADSE